MRGMASTGTLELTSGTAGNWTFSTVSEHHCSCHSCRGKSWVVMHTACSLRCSCSSGFYYLLCLLIRLCITIIIILFVTRCNHVQPQDLAEPRILLSMNLS